MALAPRIEFKTLGGFPTLEKPMATEEFLCAAQEIVAVIESFGKLFTPVVADMNGNIKKLRKTFDKNREEFYLLENLILLNIDVDKNMAADALLWLKRGLQLICYFFENIYNDAQNAEVLKKHLMDAYERTLKPYHGFFVQGTIKLIYSWVPTRSQLLGQGFAHEENMQALEVFLPTMAGHLKIIDSLLKQHNLDPALKT